MTVKVYKNFSLVQKSAPTPSRRTDFAAPRAPAPLRGTGGRTRIRDARPEDSRWAHPGTGPKRGPERTITEAGYGSWAWAWAWAWRPGRKFKGRARHPRLMEVLLPQRARDDDGGRPDLSAPTRTTVRKTKTEESGWGTWIRTKINGVRVRCSTVELSPNGLRGGTAGRCRAKRGLGSTEVWAFQALPCGRSALSVPVGGIGCGTVLGRGAGRLGEARLAGPCPGAGQ